MLRCEEQWEAIWDTMANNWNIKNIYIANDIIWHDENAGMERKVEIKKIFDIYIKILYLPHRAEGSQAVVRGAKVSVEFSWDGISKHWEAAAARSG